MKLDGKTLLEIQVAFKEKYNRTISTTSINRYGNYHIWGRGTTIDPDESDEIEDKSEGKPKEEEKESGVMEIKVEDKRKIKKDGVDQIVHFSDGEIDEKAFNKLVALRGTTQTETWEFLRKCGEKGYTKINMTTGEISQ